MKIGAVEVIASSSSRSRRTRSADLVRSGSGVAPTPLLSSVEFDPATVRHVQLVVCGYAEDRADAKLLLSMIGLLGADEERERVRGESGVIPATWRSKCQACGGPIHRGDLIRESGEQVSGTTHGVKWKHAVASECTG